MTAREEKLLALIRYALWGKREGTEITEAEAGKLLKLAKKQAVQGLAADAIADAGIALQEKNLQRILSLLFGLEQENRVRNELTAQVVTELKDNGISCIVVKGQTLAPFYLHPLHRACGDIDLYCDAENFQKAKDYLTQVKGLELDRNGEKHEIFSIGDVPFELHAHLAMLGSKKYQRYFEALLADTLRNRPYAARVNDTDIPTLEPTLNCLYLFLHIFIHLITEGIGLRQLCDWALFLHHKRAEIDAEALAKHLQNLGLRKAFCAMGAVLADHLGLPEGDFPLGLSDKAHQASDRLLADVLYEGNFGQGKNMRWYRGIMYSVQRGCMYVYRTFKYMRYAPSFVWKHLVWNYKSFFTNTLAYKLKKGEYNTFS